MEEGLFAMKNMAPGEYIILYEVVLTEWPATENNYAAELKPAEVTKGVSTWYADAAQSRSLGRFANHSCSNNSVLCKMIMLGNKLP